MFMQNKKFLLITGLSALALSACTHQPHPFPTGYTHHGKEFKSANPPESFKFTDEQRKTMTAEQAEQFRLAVYSLVESLTLRAGMPPKPVYVLRPEKMSPFYSNIDNNLNESLRHLGYNLATVPDGAYVFTYHVQLLRKAEDLKGPDGQLIDPATMSSNNVRIAIQVHDSFGKNSKMLTEEAGDFHIDGAEYMTIPYLNFMGVFLNNDGGIPAEPHSTNFPNTPNSPNFSTSAGPDKTVDAPAAQRSMYAPGSNH